ncbi:MAG: hypothetical protein COX57_12460 [Alphaproteobacteria bacterium CG_4_10_14_0_2_um_filter_63_37]|nr:MAG: hypothetical protein AUJ55_04550 [Proteobacteria bacterium CG1_02_64_396]PJA23677.1 MAG: hypothetical protein COX57_12460 [Alphaproteobacteria bacterium CG_4_10_14_0_2_um_filter_63_37]
MKHRILMAAAGVGMIAFAATAQASGLTVAEKDGQKLTVGMKGFISLASYQKDNATSAQTKTQGLAVDRWYIDMKYKGEDNWSARFTTDLQNEQGNVAGLKRNQNVFVKYAFIENHVSDAFQFRLGQAHTPWIDYEQGLWGHRYFGKVLVDELGYEHSSDLGVTFKGKPADMVKYWVTYTNGGGYGKPSAANAMDLAARVSLAPIEGLDVSLGFKSGTNASTTYTGGTSVTGTKQTLMQLMAVYQQKGVFTAGVNYLSNKSAPATGSATTTTAYSVWGYGSFGEGLGAVARYDANSNNATTKVEGTRIMVGLDYAASKQAKFTVGYIAKEGKTGGATTSKEKWMGVFSQYSF